MSRILIGVAAVASALALVISMSANAASAQPPGAMEQASQSGDRRLQWLITNSDDTQSETPAGNRFPLMLPQPTKVEGQNKYDLG